MYEIIWNYLGALLQALALSFPILFIFAVIVVIIHAIQRKVNISITIPKSTYKFLRKEASDAGISFKRYIEFVLKYVSDEIIKTRIEDRQAQKAKEHQTSTPPKDAPNLSIEPVASQSLSEYLFSKQKDK